jgi:periplasmic divalent cation tolerance protein
MTDIIEVVTTVENQEQAQAMARRLVAARLAACVQIDGPLESIYHWQGNMESATEWRCTIKTQRGLFSRVEELIRQQHTYEVPEILARPIVTGNESYIAWMNDELEMHG